MISQRRVQKHNLRLHLASSLERSVRTVHRGHDLQVRLLGEDGGDSVTHQSIVFDHEDRNSFRHGYTRIGRTRSANLGIGWRRDGVRAIQKPGELPGPQAQARKYVTRRARLQPWLRRNTPRERGETP